MPIEITCSRCGVTRHVKDKYAGLKVQCKNCGEFVRVSDAINTGVEIIDEVEEAAPEPVPEIRVRRHRASLDGQGYHMGVVVGLFAVTLILIFGLSMAIVYGFRSTYGPPNIQAIAPPHAITPPDIQPTSPFAPVPLGNADGRIVLPKGALTEIEVSLSSLRKTRVTQNNWRVEVDYRVTKGDPPFNEMLLAVVKSSKGRVEKPAHGIMFQRQGTMTLHFFGSQLSNGNETIELWIERPQSVGNGDRVVSNRISG